MQCFSQLKAMGKFQLNNTNKIKKSKENNATITPTKNRLERQWSKVLEELKGDKVKLQL
jgi:hypothetical protein